MTLEMLPGTDGNEESPKETLWLRILGTALALPGAKVNRAAFLRRQFQSYFDEAQVRKAIESRPACADIPLEVVDGLADACIWGHVIKASALSFTTGLPGGLASAATIPIDIAQFHWHALVLAQELAYLYGWPDLLEQDEVDDITKQQLTLLMGAMMGAAVARKALEEFSERFAEQLAVRLPRQALTRYPLYNISKKVAPWIGVKITKPIVARGLAKAAPVVGGVVSATLTAALMRPMARKLKNHLRGLKYAGCDGGMGQPN